MFNIAWEATNATMFNIAREKMRFKGGNMYTFKFIYVYPDFHVESEDIVLIYAWMVFPTMHVPSLWLLWYISLAWESNTVYPPASML